MTVKKINFRNKLSLFDIIFFDKNTPKIINGRIFEMEKNPLIVRFRIRDMIDVEGFDVQEG